MRGIAKLFTILFFLIIFSAAVLGIDKEYNFFKSENLKDVVAKSLEGAKGDYAVAIQNLKTSESYGLNSQKIYQPGSLYKLWVMAVAFEKVKSKELKEDDVLKVTFQDLNEEFEIATEEAEFIEGEIELTIKQALSQMITISHNYAALLLTERVGNSAITNFLKQEEFFESSIGSPPKTTAGDIALFYEKLYKGEIIDREYSKKMIDILLKQQINDRIPKYLPAGRQGLPKVAHKTGEIEFYKHDGGIVFTEKGDYIIVVLSESDFPAGAAERIANLSKNVYDYFKR